MLEWTATVKNVSYFADGQVVAFFDPDLEEPELFLIRAGLDEDVAGQVDFDNESSMVATLEMPTLAAGMADNYGVIPDPRASCQLLFRRRGLPLPRYPALVTSCLIALAGAGTGIAHAQTTPVVSCTQVVGPVEGVATGVACISFTAPFYTGSGPVLMGSGTEFASCAASTGVETDGLDGAVLAGVPALPGPYHRDPPDGLEPASSKTSARPRSSTSRTW